MRPWHSPLLSHFVSPLPPGIGELVVLVGLGALTYGSLEGRTAVDSIYWACITLTTVGFGDQAPKALAGKAFAIVYIVFGTYLCARWLQQVAQLPARIKKQEMEKEVPVRAAPRVCAPC